ncbi:MAG: hypothetical protein NZL91_01345 [Thermoflexales bacterium]|nr:hypothetical protein [Thermoflexales bacterium]MCS7325635.1 hypothetical protein [Thermoflexales bacterium]MCX7938012.1 hypothetical protein [Thermoflexales bacterium]MDW8053952.1 hypothetical protein [Anaerolineae bacterium]MDW8293074.1 hypothetical protein [Anaerolineae bacterium]
MRGLSVAFGVGLIGFMIALGIGISAQLSAVMVAMLMGVMIGALVTAPTVALVMWAAMRRERASATAPVFQQPLVQIDRTSTWSVGRGVEGLLFPAPSLQPQPRRFYVIGDSGEVTELSPAEGSEETRW